MCRIHCLQNSRLLFVLVRLYSSALLKARKKGEPTKEWLDQLPHKTRVLEDKLYKKARSLEEYVDRTTLKNRLRRLAVTIAAHYNESVKKSKRRSVGSLSSIATVPHRNSLLSFGDTDDNTANMTAQLLAARSGSTQNNIIFSAEGRMGTVARPTANGNNDQQHNKVPSEMAISDLARQKTAQNGIVSNIQQQQVLVNGVRKGSNSLSGGITDNGNSAGANKSATGKDSGSSTVVTQQVGDTGETRLQNSSGNGTNSGDNKGDNTDARRSQFYGIATTNNVLQGNQIDIGTHAMPMMSDSSQAGLIGQQSMPVASSFNNGNSSIGDMNSHAALTGQQSMPISTGGGGGAVQLGGNHNQAQIQLQQLMAQQAALSMQQNSGVGNLAQQQVMQAEFFRQASQSSAQMNMAQQAQLQAEMMRRASAASGGVNPMNQQQLLAQAQMQAEMMRRASIGSLGTMSSHAVPIGGQYGMMPQAGGMVNPVMMNQQMGQMFGNNPQMMQGNANTMQPMNMNMGQVNNVQQQQQQQQQQQNFMSNIAAVPSQNSFSMHGMVNMQNDNNNNGSNANNLQEGNGKDNTSSSENPFDW